MGGQPQHADVLSRPDGWFALAASHQIKPGAVLTRRLTGEDVVLYRTAGGRLRAIRPFCPHLGAHLGHGGRVLGENLRCPFHHFQFGPDGACVSGYEGHGAPKAALSPLETREVDGFVFVWRHALGKAPTWEIGTRTPGATMKPRSVLHETSAWPQDLMENVIDIGHVRPVHKMAVTDSYHAPVFDGHLMTMTMIPQLTGDQSLFSGTQLGLSLTAPTVTMTQSGLGALQIEVESIRTGLHLRFWVLITPLEPMRHTVTLTWTAKLANHRLPPGATFLAGRSILQLLSREYRKDAELLRNKTYLEHPRIAEGDGPLMQFRRWAQQFYSLHSGTETT